MRVFVIWCWGLSSLGSGRGFIFLNVVGVVFKLKCFFGIFILFWDYYEKFFQWFCFCEKKFAVVLFFLEVVEEVYLWSISKKR